MLSTLRIAANTADRLSMVGLDRAEGRQAAGGVTLTHPPRSFAIQTTLINRPTGESNPSRRSVYTVNGYRAGTGQGPSPPSRVGDGLNRELVLGRERQRYVCPVSTRCGHTAWHGPSVRLRLRSRRSPQCTPPDFRVTLSVHTDGFPSGSPLRNNRSSTRPGSLTVTGLRRSSRMPASRARYTSSPPM